MKTNLKKLGTLFAVTAIAAFCGSNALAQLVQPFSQGNLVVERVGNGGAALSSAGTPIFLDQFTPSGALVSSEMVPTNGANSLVDAGNSSTEGFLSLNPHGTNLVLAGYNVAAGTAAPASATAASTPRAVAAVDYNGNYKLVATNTILFTGGNIRSAATDGNGNYWAAGSVSGIGYLGLGPTNLTCAPANSLNNRVIQVIGGNIYFSTGSSTHGIYEIAGTPTTTGNSASLVINTTALGSTSPYGFAFSPDMTTAYIADSTTFTTSSSYSGIEKWTYNGSAWVFQYSLGPGTNGADGLAVDWTTTPATIYATTANGNYLVKIQDNGAGTIGVTNAIAPANTAFRSISFVPTNTPAAAAAAPVINGISPASQIVVESNTATFTLSGFTGNPIASNFWYKISGGTTNLISGQSGGVLTLTNVQLDDATNYFAILTNSSGSVTSSVAQLTVIAKPSPPGITNQPIAMTVTAGDLVTFNVGVTGTPALFYQWKIDNGTTTNLAAGAAYTGTNTDTLTIPSATVSLSGLKYFCTITNTAGATNSLKATLTVNPPPAITVADFRAKVNGSFAPTNTTSLFTLTGIVTTWADMTGVANTEFYMQDASGGIVVFWSGANGSTNLPPAGALVRVTGPMAAFNGLLEIEPVFTNTLHSVVVLSTNNPLPKAQPLPFDPNVSGYPATAKNATMDKLEGMYLVASNVMLNLTTPAFVSGANDVITNNAQHVLSATNSVATINFTNEAGQQFVLFVNAQSGLPGKAKYAGPVTIYGVLGYFTAAGYEFTPSRFEDVISYFNQSNVVSHAVRAGDLLTNTYTESRLLTGETLTSYLSIGDPEGGNVTLSPSTDGLPGSASWSGVTGGTTGTAVFHFTPVAGDAGSNYVVALGVSSTSGNSFSNSFTVYVPTTNEQQIAISEFLANPTTNSSAPNFNPLHRATDTGGAATNDMFIEIASQAANDVNLYGWGIYNGNNKLVEDFSLDAPTLSHSNAIVVYGGPADFSQPPVLPVYNEPATSKSLSLAVTGTGTIVLRNQNGNIIDRVVYAAGDLNTNGSLTRFPDNINGPFVPQPYVGTSPATAGLPYDGGDWTRPYKVPAGVNNVGIHVANGQVLFNFTANTGLASTLWGASAVNGPYSVLFGRQFPTASGAFTNSAAGPIQFYYISNQ